MGTYINFQKIIEFIENKYFNTKWVTLTKKILQNQHHILVKKYKTILMV